MKKINEKRRMSGRQIHGKNLSSLRSETFFPGAADVTSKGSNVYIRTFGWPMSTL